MTNQTTTTTSNPNSNTKTINDLPLRGAKNAPKTFKGNYEKVYEFFYEIEAACTSLKITDSIDKCAAVVRYSSRKVVEVIEGLPEYKRKDYDALKKKIIFTFDGARTEVKFRVADIYPLVKKWSQTKVKDLATFKKYYREFQKIVGWLHVRGKISDEDFMLWFWAGLPKKVQRKIEARMRLDNPALDDTKPFDVEIVTAAAGKAFTRDRFEHRIPLLIKRSAKDTDDSSSGSDSSSSEESDSGLEGETDQEAVKEAANKLKKRAHPKKKKKVRFEEPAPIKTGAEKAKKETTNDVAIDPLIEKLQKLSLRDPEYKALWVQVMRNYVTSQPEPARMNYAQGPARVNYAPDRRRDIPPHMVNNEQRFNSGNNTTFDQTAPRQCYGCGRQGHTIGRCERILKIADQGFIRKGPTGRWMWKEGDQIVQKEGESVCEAIERGLKQATFVSASRVAALSESEEGAGSGESDGSEEEDDRKACLSWRLMGDVDDREESEDNLLVNPRSDGWTDRVPRTKPHRDAMAVERTEKVSRGARYRPNERGNVQRAGQGGGFGRRDPEGRPQRMNAVPIHENVHHSLRDNGIKREAGRTVPDQDMIDVEVHQEVVPSAVGKEAEIDRKESVAKDGRGKSSDVNRVRGDFQSELKGIASEVIKEVMKQRLTLPLGELLSLAPALQRDLGRVVKDTASGPGSSRSSPPNKATTATANEKGVVKRKVYFQEGSVGKTLGKPRDGLLRIGATIGNAQMPAVIDTGAMVNIISEKMYLMSGLPKNNDKTMYIGDANGGTSRCTGMIENAEIYLSPSKVWTVGDLWVHKNPSCPLILGREWQTMNGGGTKERKEGTFVKFTSRGVKYKINASPNPEYLREIEMVRATNRRGEEPTPQKRVEVAALVVEVVEDSEEEEIPRDIEQLRQEQSCERMLQEGFEGTGRSLTYGRIPDALSDAESARGLISRSPTTGRASSYLGEGNVYGTDSEEGPEPGANKWIVEEDADDEGDDEMTKGNKSDRKKRTRRKGDTVGTTRKVESELYRHGKRRRVSSKELEREPAENGEEREVESTMIGEGSRRTWERTKRSRGEKRTATNDLNTKEEIRQEEFIRMVMTGGNQRKWETYQATETAKTRTMSHPWSDWSSGDLRTEWSPSSPDEIHQSRSEVKEELEEGECQPDTHEMPVSEQGNVPDTLDDPQDESADVATSYETVRRSMRKRRKSEKAQGDEWRRIQTHVAKTHQKTRSSSTPDRRGRRKVVNIARAVRVETDMPSVRDTRRAIEPDKEKEVKISPDRPARNERLHRREAVDVGKPGQRDKEPSQEKEKEGRSASRDRHEMEKFIWNPIREEIRAGPPRGRQARALDSDSHEHPRMRRRLRNRSRRFLAAAIKTTREWPPLSDFAPIPHRYSLTLQIAVTPRPHLLYSGLSYSYQPPLRLNPNHPLLFSVPDHSSPTSCFTFTRMTAITQPGVPATRIELSPALRCVLNRIFADLDEALRRPKIKYFEPTGLGTLLTAERDLNTMWKDSGFWQSATLGTSLIYEISNHHAFDGSMVQDYIGLGASLQIRDPQGNGMTKAGKFFMRWIPDDATGSPITNNVPHPPHDLVRIAHAYVFPNEGTNVNNRPSLGRAFSGPALVTHSDDLIKEEPRPPGLPRLSSFGPVLVPDSVCATRGASYCDDSSIPANTGTAPPRIFEDFLGSITNEENASDYFVPFHYPNHYTNAPMTLSADSPISMTVEANPVKTPEPEGLPSAGGDFERIPLDDSGTMGASCVPPFPLCPSPFDIFGCRYFDGGSELEEFL